MSEPATPSPTDYADLPVRQPDEVYQHFVWYDAPNTVTADGRSVYQVGSQGVVDVWDLFILLWRYWLGALVVIALLTGLFILWRTLRNRSKHRVGEPYCGKCNYSLIEAVADSCPECGGALSKYRKIHKHRRLAMVIAIILICSPSILFGFLQWKNPSYEKWLMQKVDWDSTSAYSFIAKLPSRYEWFINRAKGSAYLKHNVFRSDFPLNSNSTGLKHHVTKPLSRNWLNMKSDPIAEILIIETEFFLHTEEIRSKASGAWIWDARSKQLHSYTDRNVFEAARDQFRQDRLEGHTRWIEIKTSEDVGPVAVLREWREGGAVPIAVFDTTQAGHARRAWVTPDGKAVVVTNNAATPSDQPLKVLRFEIGDLGPAPDAEP